MIKIDVEGGEIDVLRGATVLLSRGRPLIQCEIHNPGNLETFGAMLADFGYSTSLISAKDIFPCEVFAHV